MPNFFSDLFIGPKQYLSDEDQKRAEALFEKRRAEAPRREREQKVLAPRQSTNFFAEFGKELIERTMPRHTFEKALPAILESKTQKSPEVIEGLAGGVTSKAPGFFDEFLQIAGDIALVAGGPAAKATKPLGTAAKGTFLGRELSSFLPKALTKPVGELFKKLPSIPEAPTAPYRPTEDAILKVTQALKEAAPARETQELLYTQERGVRLGKALEARKLVTGEAGFRAEKAALAGELEKVQFESIRGKIGQEDIDKIFQAVTDSPYLGEWEKFPARQGLTKLFGESGGQIPTEGELELLEKVFPRDFIETILKKRPFLAKLKEAGYQIANIPRSVMASFDFSFGGRQGAFAAPTFRKQFFKSWLEQFKLFGSENAYRAAQETIAKNPLYPIAREAGVSFTDVGLMMSGREEKFMSQWAERIPVVGKAVRASGRAYTGFANKLRMDIFEKMVADAQATGLDPTKNMSAARDIAKFVNIMTGRGSLGGFEPVAKALNAFFFSPRLASSRLSLLNPNYYITARPIVRQQALKSLFGFAGTVGTILGLSRLAGLEVGADPRSADFAKIKIGNTRIDIAAGFQQYIRMATQLITGQYVSSATGKVITLGEGYRAISRKDILLRQIESKEAPIFSLMSDFLKGQDYQGKPFNAPKAIIDRFIPMVAQDIYDIARDNPGLLPLGMLGIFGVGVQTYKQKAGKGLLPGLPKIPSPFGMPSLPALPKLQ